MFPIRDHTPTKSIPVINYTIIAVTVAVFLLQLSVQNFDDFIEAYGFVPSRFSLFNTGTYLTILTSIFLHGGIFHIASNLWFLHIFGDNVEDRLGHGVYPVFYVLCGIAATMSQYIFAPDSLIPMIGASGAISGVTGAYFVYFKKSKIEALVPVGYTAQTVLLPSWFFLGYWFVIQVFSGIGSLATVHQGGVAFFAHIGGFVTGYVLAKILSAENRHNQV